MLDDLKLLLDIANDDSDDLLELLLRQACGPVLNYIGEESVPLELEYIVIDLACVRYRRLGNEGINTERIDVISTSFETNSLLPHMQALDAYLENKQNSRKVKFF